MQEIEVAITSNLRKKKGEQVSIAKKQDTFKLEANSDEIKKDITAQINTLSYNIVKENNLIITSLRLLYPKFINTYYTSHSRRITKYISYFIIIF